MPSFDLSRRLAAEALGTAFLVATVVGSGIMAESLTKDVALALLGNTLPTGAVLVVLITILGPISGAHFNPAVTMVFALKRELEPAEALGYILAQIAGGIAGTVMAHAMFALPLWDASLKVRTGGPQWLAEGIAAFGLVVTILAGLKFNRPAIPWLVGLYITAAYWFTSSTSFANPAVAIARSLTNTFSGIRPVDLPGFIAAELAGALAALWLMNWLLRSSGEEAACQRSFAHERHDLSQSLLRHLAQHAGDDPRERRGAGDHRISEDAAGSRAAGRVDPGDGHFRSRACCGRRARPMRNLGLADPKWSDDELIDFMLAHPILINRPIVVTAKGTKLCRPSEAVLDLLDHPVDRFVKEDGELSSPAK